MAELTGKREAQRRVDRIHAFRQQLAELLREGALDLSNEQRAKLNFHLDRTLGELAERYDVDISESQKQISLGMRILSTLGGFAFCAALFLFFYRFWGVLATPTQVVILAGTPILGLIALDVVSRRERTAYYTALLGLVVQAAFILNLTVLADLFNLRPSPDAFLAWALFALILAYAYRLRLVLVAGLISLLIYLAATATAWDGTDWSAFLMRPENVLLGSAAVVAVPLLVRHRKLIDFPEIYRLVGLLLLFLSLEMLIHSGHQSYLPFAEGTVEGIYRLTGFVAAGVTIWLGIRHGRPGIVNLGSAFFALYIFDRLFSWWWDWMPRYLFFLIIGLITVVLLAVFRKLRGSIRVQSA